MKKRLLSLMGAIVAILIGIYTALSVAHREPVTAPAAKHTKLVQTFVQHSRVASAVSSPVPAMNEPNKQRDSEDLKRFQLYRAVMSMFDRTTAEKLGLSYDDQLALDMVVWNYRQKLNQLIAAQGVIHRTNDGAVVVSFQLDSATSEGLRDDFLASAREALGAAKWDPLEQSKLMFEIDAHMDFWGEAAAAYSFEYVPSDAPGHEAIVKMNVYSEKNPSIMRGSSLSEPMFATLYAPIALKIGF